jgi:2-phospho-L-lactate/phosphoenolpyruvate guanylyltransferase
MPTIWAVLPVKEFAGAKQRLAGRFSPEFRRALAATMVEDVLAALAGSRRLSGIVMVTCDPDAAALGRRYGAEICARGATAGHTAAVLAGGRDVDARGADGMLALPGDVPGVTAEELDALVAGHGAAPSFSIVPAHDARGSNAIVATPPDVVPLAYGDDSFLPHLAAARAAGVEARARAFPGIGLDVDNPEDLFALADRGWPTRTGAFLKASGAFAAARGEGVDCHD